MKTLKRIIAALLCAAVCAGFAGCHPENEVALTVDGHEYTSAFYMCALLQADGEAKTKVDEAYEEDDKSTDDINYFKEKIEKKSYEDWVKDRAVEIIRIYGYVESMCDKNNVKLDDEELEEAESYADSYWNYYGYSAYYGANGVSYNTFREYYTYSNLMQKYFMSIYGKEGTDAVPEQDVKNALNEKFALADTLSITLTDSEGNTLSDDEIEAKKKTLEGYKARLDKGEAFKAVYEAENGEGSSEGYTINSEEDLNQEERPQDSMARIYGNEDTETYASDYYDDIAGLKTGESKIIDDSDNSALLLVQRKDIFTDPYYLNNMYESIVTLLKYDDFEEDTKKAAKKLDFDRNKYATNRFKVKKLKDGTEE